MAIKEIKTENCIGCKACDLVCPMDVIYFSSEKKHAEIKHPQDCQTCYLCQIACPKDCIVVTAERAEKIVVY